ncbi:MAG: NUDIX hydrolase [Candidatus Krumholzibacteria bacterium]|nr:NUDIX hydrolase [Candidatus Krumholzibacteria bacterium]
MIGKFEYCPLCAARLEDRRLDTEDKMRPVCPRCGFIHYDNPTPAAGVVLFSEGQLLLVQRKHEPRVGMWTLPAGFVEAGEEVPACVIRETKEETNIDTEIIRLFGVYSAFDDPRASVILILYLARQIAGELECGDDASDAGFFDLDNLPKDIAFRAHRAALADIKKQVVRGLL